MSDIKFSLPGSESVTISGTAVDKLIRAGDGDATLLYLYIIKTRGESTSSQAEAALGKTTGWVATAMAVLSRLGLVQVSQPDDQSAASSQPGQSNKPNQPNHPDQPNQAIQPAAPHAAPHTPPHTPPPEPRRYTIEEIKRELREGSDFAAVVEETQRSLGRILAPDDLLRLFGIYDALRLPPEVILQLITHCINESRMTGGGRAPSLKYIEKAAYTWEREGIFSLDKAEIYIKALEARRSVRGEIKWALQIKDREFSETEKKFVDGWIDLAFDADAISIAYDRTLIKTGKLSWGYMDSIIKSWHSKGLHTAREILAKDVRSEKSFNHGKTPPPDKKFSEPNRAEMERMMSLLNKLKEQE